MNMDFVGNEYRKQEVHYDNASKYMKKRQSIRSAIIISAICKLIILFHFFRVS